VLTNLLDMEGVKVVASTHEWDRPDSLALRHYFAADSPFRPYASFGLNRAVYLYGASPNLTSPDSQHTGRSVGVMAELGAAWTITRQFEIEGNVHWFDASGDARLLRTTAGWISADPVAVTLLVVWRGN
jgi:outer membrane protein W